MKVQGGEVLVEGEGDVVLVGVYNLVIKKVDGLCWGWEVGSG